MDIENALFHQDIKSGKEFPVKLRMKRLFSDCSAFQLIFISQSETSFPQVHLFHIPSL